MTVKAPKRKGLYLKPRAEIIKKFNNMRKVRKDDEGKTLSQTRMFELLVNHQCHDQS